MIKLSVENMNPPTEADGFVSSLRAGPPARHRALGPADPARTAELSGSDLFVRSSRSVGHADAGLPVLTGTHWLLAHCPVLKVRGTSRLPAQPRGSTGIRRDL